MIIASADANSVSFAAEAQGWRVTTWFASVFMEDYQICDAIRPAGIRKLFYDVVSSIYPI